MPLEVTKIIEIVGVVDKVVPAIKELVGFLTSLFKKKQEAAKLPAGVPARHTDILDEDIPDPKKPKVTSGTNIAKAEINPLRVVLSAKRFPKEDAEGTLSYVPDSWKDAIPFQSKITFECLVEDGNGNGVNYNGAGSELRYHAAFYLRDPRGNVAKIGPGQDPTLKDTDSIGAGGANYINSGGAVGTFRVVDEGEYAAWVEFDGVKSPEFGFRVS